MNSAEWFVVSVVLMLLATEVHYVSDARRTLRDIRSRLKCLWKWCPKSR
jgi:hypothetical protein